jgi:myosin heavy subunit
MRINEILLQEQALDEAPILGQIASGVRGAAAGFQQSRQQRSLDQQQKMIANIAYKQWNRKAMSLANAAQGQPVDATDYENHLVDFVEKVILTNRSIKELDLVSQQKLEGVIGNIVQNRSDRATVQRAFGDLVIQAAASRVDPAKQKQQTVNVDQMIQRMQTRPISKTGNVAVDQLLTALGIPLT